MGQRLAHSTKQTTGQGAAPTAFPLQVATSPALAGKEKRMARVGWMESCGFVETDEILHAHRGNGYTGCGRLLQRATTHSQIGETLDDVIAETGKRPCRVCFPLRWRPTRA